MSLPWAASVASSLLLPSLAHAQATAAPSDAWKCELCVGSPGYSLELKIGPSFLLDDAFPFGDYKGIDEKGSYGFGDLFTRYIGEDGSYGMLEGYVRGSDAYGIFAEGGKQGRYRTRISVESIPRRFLDGTRTPFLGTGTANLVLPSNWVKGPTTAQMTALQSSATPLELRYDRKRYGLGLDYNLKRDLVLSVDFRRQKHDGVARSSGAILFSALEFASPLDYTTDDIEFALKYSKTDWQASVSYLASTFGNDNLGVGWNNPYTPIAGADQGLQALPPDNEAHRLTLAGSASLPARTTVSGHLAIGRLKQDARLLPFTANPALPATPLPVPTANAEVDTLSFDLRAVSSPWSKLTLEGELRRNDFDNKTPVNLYDYVVTDVRPASTPAASTSYDYERRQIKFRGEYRLVNAVGLEFGADTDIFKRKLQDRRRTTTDRVWAKVKTRLAGVSELNVDVFTENRDGSSYDTVVDPETPENPLMRKYNMADRTRDGVQLRGTYFGGARSDVGVEIEVSRDRYDETELGLTDTDYQRVGADFSFLLGKAGSVYASVYKERYETGQASSQSFSLPDWLATTDDEFTTTTVGAAHPELFHRIDAKLELMHARSVGSISNDTSGLASSFPDIRNRRRTAHLALGYPLSSRLKVGLDYFVEEVRSDDWALDGVDLATVTSLLSLGGTAWNYDARVVYLSVQYGLAP